MTPGYALNIPLLQEAITPWLPGNPEKDAFVRPNQETAQVYVQLRAHGFDCVIDMLCVRPEKTAGVPGNMSVMLFLEHGKVQFDARDMEPYEVLRDYCDRRGIDWQLGDPMDLAIGKQAVSHFLAVADKAPNPGLYRAIEGALAQMRRDHIDADTQQATGVRKGGRL